ncbi:unnamed protein product, partial [Prorocentrum cordatum]
RAAGSRSGDVLGRPRASHGAAGCERAGAPEDADGLLDEIHRSGAMVIEPRGLVMAGPPSCLASSPGGAPPEATVIGRSGGSMIARAGLDSRFGKDPPPRGASGGQREAAPRADGGLPAGRPRTPSPRTCRLLGAVETCAAEMEGLQLRMSRLRTALWSPGGPARGRHHDGSSAGGGEDSDLLEAERNLGEYLARAASAARRGAGAHDAARAPGLGGFEDAGLAHAEDVDGGLSDYLPASVASAASAGRPRTPLQSRSLPGSPRRPVRAARAGGARADDERSLLLQVRELGHLAEARAAEIQELRGEVGCVPVASAELASLVEEARALTLRSREGAAQVAELRAERAAFTGVLDADLARAGELQEERRALLDRIGGSERGERQAMHSKEGAELEADAEKRRSQEELAALDDSLEAARAQAEGAELRWSKAEAAIVELEGQQIKASGLAAEQSRASELSLERQARCEQALQAQRGRACEARLAALDAELAEARAQASELRGARAALAARLGASRRGAEETEQKALRVARELVDSSQAILWLRSEAAAQQGLRLELSEARARGHGLRQRLRQAPADHGGADGGRELALLRPAEGGLAAGPSEEAGRQLPTVSGALRAAWEAEAREQRAAQKRLTALQDCMAPLQQQLLRLRETARGWRERLLRPGPCGAPLPPVPDEAAWNAMLAHAVAAGRGDLEYTGGAAAAAGALCECIEALVEETSRQLAAAGEGAAPAGQERLLTAEGQALRQELEQLERRARQRPPSPGLGSTPTSSCAGDPPGEPRAAGAGEGVAAPGSAHSRRSTAGSSASSASVRGSRGGGGEDRSAAGLRGSSAAAAPRPGGWRGPGLPAEWRGSPAAERFDA